MQEIFRTNYTWSWSTYSSWPRFWWSQEVPSNLNDSLILWHGTIFCHRMHKTASQITSQALVHKLHVAVLKLIQHSYLLSQRSHYKKFVLFFTTNTYESFRLVLSNCLKARGRCDWMLSSTQQVSLASSWSDLCLLPYLKISYQT